jgi:hypothetical protein
MMKLVADPGKEVSRVALVYRAKDYAFSAEPRPADADTSLSVNDLELMVDGRDNRVVFVTGYCPHQAWRPAKLTVPQFRRAGLVVETDRELPPGVSTRLNSREARWPVLVDARAGWVCLEMPGAREAAGLDAVEFAPGCLAVLDDGQLVALWLHPKELPAEVSDRLPS